MNPSSNRRIDSLIKFNSMKKNIFSAGISFLIFIVSGSVSFSSPRNVLIEYVTGTWCGNCPCGHQTLDTIQSQFPQTIILAYHAFSNDPWRNFNGNHIIELLGLVATPTADIDRTVLAENTNYPQWITSVQERYSSSPESVVDISIASKSYNEITRELAVSVNFSAAEILTGQYKFNAVVIENNLIYQQNYYSQCGTPGYVQDYVHDNVVRNMVNGAEGGDLNSNNVWNANENITKNFITIIDNQWTAENCKIVIFAYKTESTLAYSTVHQAIQENVTGVTGISGNGTEIAGGYNLSQNYPNPFNPVTNIKFTIPSGTNAKFKVYDMLGNEVTSYFDGYLNKGSYNVTIDGSNLSTGIYFYRLITDNFDRTKRMVLIR